MWRKRGLAGSLSFRVTALFPTSPLPPPQHTFPLRPPLSVAAGNAAAGMLGVTLRGVRLSPPSIVESTVAVLVRGAPSAGALALRSALAAALGRREEGPVALAPRPSSADNVRRGLKCSGGVAKRTHATTPHHTTTPRAVKKPAANPAAAIGFARATYSPNAAFPPGPPRCPLEGVPDLTPEQEMVVSAIVHGRESVFFTGAAGSGKSVVLRHIIARLPPAPATAVVAPTGLAAAALGGVTLHSFAGVPPSALTQGRDAAVAYARRSPATLARWRALRTLVIDEVSMLDAATFDALDAVARAARGRPTIPWGGVQLCVSGCFFQLPPVRAVGGRAFQAASWSASLHRCLELTTVHRQAGDARFAALLNRVRVGAATAADVSWLARECARPLPPSPDGVAPTRLLTHRSAVDAVNERELSDLPGELVEFTATDDGDTDTLDASTRAPRALRLKVGAQVLLTKNVDRTLANGARGVVVGFQSRTGAPLVRFAPARPAVPLPRSPHPISTWGGRRAVRYQVPLTLAFALSIHKAQGMTLAAVEVDASAAFEHGMSYVALSRATSAAGLRLLGPLSLDALAADEEVVAFYGRLENSAQRRTKEDCVVVAPPLLAVRAGGGGGLRVAF